MSPSGLIVAGVTPRPTRARRSKPGKVFGVAWGGGIFVNYAFSGLWLTEALWWWVSPTTYQSRSQRQTMIIWGTFLFMILNGAVIFVDGPMRWVGVLLVGGVVAIWTRKY